MITVIAKRENGCDAQFDGEVWTSPDAMTAQWLNDMTPILLAQLGCHYWPNPDTDIGVYVAETLGLAVVSAVPPTEEDTKGMVY